MKITKLEPQKRKAGRYNLEVDDKFSCGLDEALITELNLYVGKEITDKVLRKIQETDDYHKCLNKAFSLVSIRMNSENELRKKLAKKFGYKTINKVISRLKELDYVNDEFFVKNWIQARENSRGRYLLKKELRQKGIEKELIDKFLVSRNSETELENARLAMTKKKWPEMTRDEKYQKIGGFLARRGFDYETIKQVINEM
jgi:regulatory protein